MKTLTLFWLVALGIALLLVGIVMAESVFFDDFEAGADKWPDLPTLAIEKDPDNPGNQVLAFDTTKDNANVDALFLEGFENLTDYTMRAKFNIVGETANYAVTGILVRVKSVTEYMLIEPANKRQAVKGILNIFERSGGNWPIVADGQIKLDLNKWYELSVTVEGKTLTAYIDGKKISEYAKVGYPKGGFGLREWQSKSLIDNVEVYDAGGSSIQAVKKQGKLATTWSTLKAN